jgi:hypothetical protein
MLQKLHGRVIGGHFFLNITIKKILDVDNWWLTMNCDVQEYCRTYDQCQQKGNLLT